MIIMTCTVFSTTNYRHVKQVLYGKWKLVSLSWFVLHLFMKRVTCSSCEPCDKAGPNTTVIKLPDYKFREV